MIAVALAALAIATATPALPDPAPTVVYGPCPDGLPVEGCADVQHNTIYLTTRDRYVRLHEYGHVVDHQSLDSVERGRFEQLAHDPGPWFTPDDTPADPGEEFADAYAMCRMHADPVPDRYGDTWWPAITAYEPMTLAGFKATCRFITRSVAKAQASSS